MSTFDCQKKQGMTSRRIEVTDFGVEKSADLALRENFP